MRFQRPIAISALHHHDWSCNCIHYGEVLEESNCGHRHGIGLILIKSLPGEYRSHRNSERNSARTAAATKCRRNSSTSRPISETVPARRLSQLRSTVMRDWLCDNHCLATPKTVPHLFSGSNFCAPLSLTQYQFLTHWFCQFATFGAIHIRIVSTPRHSKDKSICAYSNRKYPLHSAPMLYLSS